MWQRGRCYLRLTIFGLTISSSWGNGHATPYRAILRALARRGHEITFFERDVEYYAKRRDFSACDYCDLVLYPSYDHIRSRALKSMRESDVVITASYVPEGSRINDDVLSVAGPKKVFYDLDTPITLSKLRNGPVDYLRRDQIPEFDLVLSWTGGAALRSLEEDFGATLARPLFGCVDPDVYVQTELRRDFECELSYMGTYAPDRQDKVDALFLEPAQNYPDKQFLLAGALYPYGWTWPTNVRRFDHISPRDHPALYSSSRFTLNVTRAEMAESGYCPSGRLFEAAACGAPILSDWFEGLNEFFEPGREILTVRSSADVNAALNIDNCESARISRLARERTLDEHTGNRRAEDLLRYLNEPASVEAKDPTVSLREKGRAPAPVVSNRLEIAS